MDNPPQQQPQERINKNINHLAKAIDRVYGTPWNLLWRNFLSGIMRALGATVGYVLFIGIAVFIARQLGVFDALEGYWNSVVSRLPFEQETTINPEILEQLQKQYQK
jgi:hypothetical protein